MNIQQLETELAALETRRGELTGELATAKSAQETAFNDALSGAPTRTLIEAQNAVFALESLLSGIGQREGAIRQQIEAIQAQEEATRRREEGREAVFASLEAYENAGTELDAARDELHAAIFGKLPQVFALMDRTFELARDAKQTQMQFESEFGPIDSPKIEQLRKLQGHDLLSRVVGKTTAEIENIDLEMLWGQLFKSSLKINVQAARAGRKSSETSIYCPFTQV